MLRLRDACIGDEVRRMRIRRRIRIRGGEEGVVQEKGRSKRVCSNQKQSTR